MDILNNEFLLFLSCAFKNGLKYLLVGGYAVNYYGYNRKEIFEIEKGLSINFVSYGVLIGKT